MKFLRRKHGENLISKDENAKDTNEAFFNPQSPPNSLLICVLNLSQVFD